MRYQTMEPDSIEIQLYTLEEICKRYGYIVKDYFGEFHIYTKYESWKFTPRENGKGKIRLLHGNEPGKAPRGWHVQFTNYIDMEELVRYIHEHETAKYEGRVERFSCNPYNK